MTGEMYHFEARHAARNDGHTKESPRREGHWFSILDSKVSEVDATTSEKHCLQVGKSPENRRLEVQNSPRYSSLKCLQLRPPSDGESALVAVEKKSQN